MTRFSLGAGFCALVLACMSGTVLADPVEQQVRKQLKLLQPDLMIEEVSPVAGSPLYQVQLSGGQFLYVDESAEFILHGQLYQVGDSGAVNLTEQAQQKVAATLLETLDPADMVVFPAQDTDKKASITVFTDVDCGYCQKLHGEVPELNKAGVEVRYLAWPRQGLSGKTYDTMVSIWCAEDQQQAMTNAKQRKAVAPASCKHPVDRQHALGQQLGIRGTPAILLEDGRLLPGYMPAQQLLAQVLQK